MPHPPLLRGGGLEFGHFFTARTAMRTQRCAIFQASGFAALRPDEPLRPDKRLRPDKPDLILQSNSKLPSSNFTMRHTAAPKTTKPNRLKPGLQTNLASSLA